MVLFFCKGGQLGAMCRKNSEFTQSSLKWIAVGSDA
jgi:hypothetical protein